MVAIRKSQPYIKLTLFLVPLTLLSGCQRAPSFDIFGSFFPVWFLCIIGGILLMLLCRHFFIKYRLDSDLGPLILIYPCLAAFFSFLIWLAFFDQ